MSAANLSKTGSYNLNLECLVPVSPDAVPLACGTIAPDRSVHEARSISTHAPARRDDHFTGVGQHRWVLGRGGSTSAELTLLGPSGAVVGVLRSNSQANFTLPESGTYIIRVSASNLSTIGSYRVTLGCST